MNLFRLPFYLQLTAYSCSAAVYQTVVRALTGKHISHYQAMRDVRCTRSGTDDKDLKKALREHGLRIRTVGRKVVKFNAVLDEGGVVVTSDMETYDEPHCICVCGRIGRWWIVNDPARAARLAYPKELVGQADGAYAVTLK